MKRLTIISVLILSVSLLKGDTKLMLIGDSITKGIGSANGLGFRDDLYDSLNVIGYDFTLAGSSGTIPYQGCFFP